MNDYDQLREALEQIAALEGTDAWRAAFAKNIAEGALADSPSSEERCSCTPYLGRMSWAVYDNAADAVVEIPTGKQKDARALVDQAEEIVPGIGAELSVVEVVDEVEFLNDLRDEWAPK